jgi:hypothetical protein
MHRRPANVGVIVTATVAAVSATIWAAVTHSVLLYGDARAHLDVARHVTDGLRTGPTQLGSVWLPLPHILLVPLVAWRPLWHSGAAGAIVGGACFVYAAVRMFTLVEEVTTSRLAAWCGFAIFAANLNLLYVQTTALTEPVLLAFFVGATYHLARWMRTLSVRELVWAAFLICCASLTRYEGWALLGAATAVVVVWSRLADRRRKSGQANLVVFLGIGSYGIVLWLIYNLTIFHDPLYFLHSAYSAQAINRGQAQFGLLGTRGSIGESVLTYAWDVLAVVGPIVLLVGVVTAAALVLTRTPERRRTALILMLLFAPVAFEVLSLYLGETTIRVPQRPPHGMWNDRYGLLALPWCAFAIGAVVPRWRWTAPLAAMSAAVGVALMALGTPLTLADGRSGTSSAAAGHPELAAAYLHHHYRGGLVLADDSMASAFMFATDLDLKQFVTVGFHPYWEHAIVSPGANVAWAVAFPGDAISADVSAHPDRFSRFQLVMTDGGVRLYQRDPNTPLARTAASAKGSQPGPRDTS